MTLRTSNLLSFCYNKAMKMQPDNREVSQLLRITAGLCLGYWLALAFLDNIFYPHPLFVPLYYVVNGLNALAVLGMAHWRWLQKQAGRLFLPTAIALISALPLVIYHVMVLQLPPDRNPARSIPPCG